MTNHLPDTTNQPARPINVLLIAYEGAQMSAVLGLEDLLSVANQHCAQNNQTQLRVETLAAHQISSQTQTYNAIILPPNMCGARGAQDADLIRFIKDQHDQGCSVCAACAGVFWLGHAGLLSGRSVTTHWALESEFRAQFPEAKLQPEHILIDEHDIVTAGGMMAWVDLGLLLVERYLGIATLTYTARHLLVDLRGRQQSNYRTFRPILTHRDRAILRLQHWMEAHPDTDLSVNILSMKSGYSARTFIRKFKAATGLSPNAYVQALRVEKARGLLEQTDRSVQEISWSVGYQDTSAFGRVFRAITGTTPGEYRTRFGVFTRS